MSTPKCVGCTRKPVKRARASEQLTQRGPRIVDGVRYRWFCSRTCGGADTCLAQMASPQFLAGRARHNATQRQARITRIVAICRAQMTADGFVPVKEAAKALAALERRAYARGLDRGKQIARQEQVA